MPVLPNIKEASFMRVKILPGKWKYEFYINNNNIISSENKDFKISQIMLEKSFKIHWMYL
jgi:hypothetical protein